MNNEILEFCDREHAQIEHFYSQYLEHKSAQKEEVMKFFKRFKCSLHRHMCMEEDVFFRFFEEETGLKQIGPTFFMRKDHQEIRKILKSMQDKIQNDLPGIANDEMELMSLFSHHGAEEDHILLNISQTVTCTQKDEMLEKLKNFSKGCCQLCLK